MKTKILLLALLFFAATTSFAQTKIGITAGVNLANLTGSDAGDNNAMKIGVHGGLVADLGISDNFMIEPGVLFSMKGSQDSENSDNKLTLNYIEIPILAKYKLESGLNFFLGPYVGFLMSATADPGGVDVKDFMETTDFGLKVGIGYQLESGLGFNAHYEMGLATIAKDVAGESQTVNNTVIGIGISYMFGGK
jgi:hypothetical protein